MLGLTILTSVLSRPCGKLLAAALALLAFPHAWAACDVQPQYPLAKERSAQRITLQYLQGVQDQCLRNSHYYAWRGALELSLGHNHAALESLERALLLQPDLPGAQLDYAQALLTQGDTLAAQELLQLLAQRHDLPPAVQELLGQTQAHAQFAATNAGSSPAPSITRLQLSSALGWDSNLNSAPRTDTLQLSMPNLPGGSLTLPLARSSLPQSGALWLSQVAVQQLRTVGAGNHPSALLLSAQLANRSTNTSAKTSYQQAELAAHWLQAPQAPAQWLLSANYRHLHYGGQPWFDEWQLIAQRQYQWHTYCRASAGLKWEQRSWHSSAELNGQYQGLLTGLDCSTAAQAGLLNPNPINWGLQLSRGHDQPSHAARPGGRYTRTELRAHAGLVHGPWQFNGSWLYQQQSDSQGYSPLLAQGSPRRTYRHSWELQASRALGTRLAPATGGQLRWFISLQHSQQHSNISVFGTQQHSLHTGLRWVN